MDLSRTADLLQTVRTPLILAGLVVVVMYLLFRQTLHRLPKESEAFRTLSARMMVLLFWLALAATVLGFAGFLAPVRRPEVPATLFGKIYEKGDLTRGIAGARVFLEQQDLKSADADSTGHFVFSLTDDRLEKGARLWATAEGYVPSEPVAVLLLRGMDRVALALEPQQTIPDQILARARSGNQLRRASSGRITRRFEFEYTLGPYPGKRSWLQSPDGSWLEVYPNGLFAIFRPRGETIIEGCKGSILRNLDNPWYEVFVPVPGCEKPWLRFRQYDGAWEYMAVIAEE
jgi:hypothetical protein